MPEPKTKKLLIIDDDTGFTTPLKQFVASFGYHVTVCESLADARKEISRAVPDIVLLDLKMPGIDGHEVLRRIKNAEKLKRLPVIILTSSIDEGDRAMSYDNGANSYLVKPVSFDDFLKVVKTVADYWLTLNVEPPLN